MLSLVADSLQIQADELRSRDSFLSRVSALDARWFGGGLRSMGERPLADPAVPESYRFSWFTPERTLLVARISSYPIGVFGQSWIAEGWPADPRRRGAPRRLSPRTLLALRVQIEKTDWSEPGSDRSNGRWLLESWRHGDYRACVDWGEHLSALPAGGLALLLLTDLNN